MKILFLFSLSFLVLFPAEFSFGGSDPILITRSSSMSQVIFDGKWTHSSEWKQSSHDMYSFDDGNSIVHLRTAHFENYIYIFIDPIHDLTLDKDSDGATVCFDAKNNKTDFFDDNDFCFSSSLSQNTGKIFQGTFENGQTTMKQILNPDDFVAISSPSDENDRYSDLIHPSYEFRIPIELLERSDNYGFYFSVYDAGTDKFFTWPEKSQQNALYDFPTPSNWGDLVSPDKSLPELPLPVMILALLVLTITLAQLKSKHRF